MSNDKSNDKNAPAAAALPSDAKVARVAELQLKHEIEIPRVGNAKSLSRKLSTADRLDGGRVLESVAIVYLWGARQFQVTITDRTRPTETGYTFLVPVENCKYWTLAAASEGDAKSKS